MFLLPATSYQLAGDQRRTEQTLEHTGRAAQCCRAIAFVRRPMHCSEHSWLQRRELLEMATRLRREGHVIHQHGMCLIGRHCLFVSPDDVAARDGLELAELMKEVRTEQHG